MNIDEVMKLDTDALKKKIGLLINSAYSELKTAFKTGNADLYHHLGEVYGPTAHLVYINSDAPSKSFEWGFYDNPNRSVMLDPWTVINRSEVLMSQGKNSKPNNPEFWEHPDVIKAFVEYLILKTTSESANDMPF